MGKINSFNLAKGTRIGNYRLLKKIGSGFEGEVYKVAEVPTEAIRALKLFRNDNFDSTRFLTHFAWYYEQIRLSRSVPIYYHYGQWFLDDDSGCWYLIFEYIPGKILLKEKHTEELFFKIVNAMARVHLLGYAVGDISNLTNIIVRQHDDEPIFVDCNPGKPDKPNIDFKSDCQEELPEIAKKMFLSNTPLRVENLIIKLKEIKRFSSKSLFKISESV